MATITLQGNEIHTNGELPDVGQQAPDFKCVGKDLNDIGLEEFAGKKKILSIVPSLDTPVCAESTKNSVEYVSAHEDRVLLVISADLPFAMTRFCSKHDIDQCVTLSMMRNKDFATDYGVLIQDGPLAGLTVRAVLCLAADNQVLYTQMVSEIAHEPDYVAALAAFA